MKIIVSHDIDHLNTIEHFKDLYLIKSLVKDFMACASGNISFAEYRLRVGEFFNNKLNYLVELAEFDKSNGVKATFFSAMSNGLSLSYSQSSLKPWLSKLDSYKYFDLGIHGIAYSDIEKMSQEYSDFKKLSGQDSFGIRMHYLRNNEKTIGILDDLGYLYDSTLYSEGEPYLQGKLWEFPLNMMDVYELKSVKKTLPNSEIEVIVKKRINDFVKKDHKFLTINFHDRYFSAAYRNYFNWYKCLIKQLVKEGHEFINFRDAIKILDKEIDKRS